jgi:hypothetical protein
MQASAPSIRDSESLSLTQFVVHESILIDGEALEYAVLDELV